MEAHSLAQEVRAARSAQEIWNVLDRAMGKLTNIDYVTLADVAASRPDNRIDSVEWGRLPPDVTPLFVDPTGMAVVYVEYDDDSTYLTILNTNTGEIEPQT